MDPNTTMETIGEGAKALTKFQEIVLKVFGPRFTKRQADADAYADERKLQTIRDNPDMEIVYANGQMNARARTPEALALRAEQRQLAESIKQEGNLEDVMEIAGEELQSAERISDDPVDEDWIARFIGIAKDVNTDDMKFLWGKILAGEIASPKSFSLRTLETIRHMSADEAKLFERILPYVVISGTAIFVPMALLDFEEFGIKYDDIIRLDECGLLNSTGTASLQSKPLPKCVNLPLFNTKNELLTISNPNSIELSASISAYPLTRSAIELIKILDYSSNHEFFVRFAEKIHKENYSSSQMTIYQIVKNEKGEDCFDTKKPVYTFCPITIRRTGLASQ